MTQPRRARHPKSRQLLDDNRQPIIADTPDSPDHFPARALIDGEQVVYVEGRRAA